MFSRLLLHNYLQPAGPQQNTEACWKWAQVYVRDGMLGNVYINI